MFSSGQHLDWFGMNHSAIIGSALTTSQLTNQVKKSVNAITFNPLLETTTHLDLDNENSPYLDIISLQEALNTWTTD